MTIEQRQFDCLVIGAGGGGLRAAAQLADADAHVAVVSKVFPTRSHTVAAQGGMNAALGNVLPDNWHWHMYDTIKGSDYLGDQDAIEYMCRAASRLVIELEHFGVPFTRLDNGKIYQRPFGGQSQNFGGDQAARTCAAADRTGHAILHSLYQQNLRAKTQFFDEYFAIDLLTDKNGFINGALVLGIETGELVIIEAKTTLIATGGAGQLFRTTTNALINTGDGMAMALRAGLPLQDMEFFQFHPTGIAGKGMLITEGVRGEGGYLINKHGERFMERYAPNAKDLASRDVVSRAIATEVRDGHGCGPDGDHVLLKVDHLGPEVIKKRLPGIRDISMTFMHVDPIEEPIPVFPTAHYTMGGIPTNRYGQVVAPEKTGAEESIPGLYAVGECACVSVHGANRLGGNSLLDIVVFGRAAGNHIIDELKQQRHHRELDQDSVDRAMERLHSWDKPRGDETVDNLRRELAMTMEKYCSVFRTEEVMQQGLDKVLEIEQRLQHVSLRDHSKVFNTARIEALELENLLDIALATVNTEWNNFLQQYNPLVTNERIERFDYAGSASTAPVRMTALSFLGTIRVSGTDAAELLQGQLTNDVTQLDGQQSHLSGLCTPKGRLIASFRLWKTDEDYYLSLPRDLLETVIKRLRMFVLRSKAVIEDVSDETVSLGLSSAATPLQLANTRIRIPEETDQLTHSDGLTLIRLHGQHPRFQVFGDTATVIRFWQEQVETASLIGHGQWLLEDIDAGVPSITRVVSEAFVPQMVNLNLLNGVSFTKGCYTGQEIVARMQYLGSLKRRLYRAEIEATDISIGNSIYAEDSEQAQGQVLACEAISDTTSRLLFVCRIDVADNKPLHAGSIDGPRLTLLDLPYPVILNADTQT